MAAPPRWLNALFAAGLVPFTIVLCSPNGQLSDAGLGYLGLITFATVVCWGLAFLMHLGSRVALRTTGESQPRWRWGWLVIPVVLVACLAVQRSGILWAWRWQWARAGFQARLATAGNSGGGWIGSFHVLTVFEHSDGSVWFALGFPDLYSDGPPQLIYAPTGPQQTSPVLVNLGGGWWLQFDNT